MAYAGAKRKRGSTSKRGTKRTFKRRRMAPGRSGTFAKRVKAVVLKTSETKMYNREFNSGSAAFPHFAFDNVSHRLDLNTFALERGNSDGTNIQCRTGDEVYVRGVKLFFRYNANATGVDQHLKWWFLRFPSGMVPSSVPVQAVTQNLIMDMIDTEKCKVISVGTHRVVGNNPVDTAADDKKVCFFKRWIPMKNMKIRYQGSGILDCRYEFALFFVAYRDGTVSQQIGNVNGSMAMYFKDP